jgi:hypothetical protein
MTDVHATRHATRIRSRNEDADSPAEDREHLASQLLNRLAGAERYSPSRKQELADALKRRQSEFGLPPTGQLDAETVSHLQHAARHLSDDTDAAATLTAHHADAGVVLCGNNGWRGAVQRGREAIAHPLAPIERGQASALAAAKRAGAAFLERVRDKFDLNRNVAALQPGQTKSVTYSVEMTAPLGAKQTGSAEVKRLADGTYEVTATASQGLMGALKHGGAHTGGGASGVVSLGGTLKFKAATLEDAQRLSALAVGMSLCPEAAGIHAALSEEHRAFLLDHATSFSVEVGADVAARFSAGKVVTRGPVELGLGGAVELNAQRKHSVTFELDHGTVVGATVAEQHTGKLTGNVSAGVKKKSDATSTPTPVPSLGLNGKSGPKVSPDVRGELGGSVTAKISRHVTLDPTARISTDTLFGTDVLLGGAMAGAAVTEAMKKAKTDPGVDVELTTESRSSGTVGSTQGGHANKWTAQFHVDSFVHLSNALGAAVEQRTPELESISSRGSVTTTEIEESATKKDFETSAGGASIKVSGAVTTKTDRPTGKRTWGGPQPHAELMFGYRGGLC